MTPPKVTIEKLDVELEVDGDDAAVFERLFRQHIERWSREEKRRHEDDKRLSKSRRIGGKDER